jgi:2-dehydro-3-deoxygluconokinase
VIARCLELGAASVAVTLGSDGVVLGDAMDIVTYPAVTVSDPRDATGAGDVFAGVVTGRLASGDALADAVALGVVAAGLSVQHRGGLGGIPQLADIRVVAGQPAAPVDDARA